MSELTEPYYALSCSNTKLVYPFNFSVLYCTLLASSQSEREREEICEKMRQDEHLARILRQLETGKGDEEEQSTSTQAIRHHEQMQDSSESAEGQVVGHRQMLDLSLIHI